MVEIDCWDDGLLDEQSAAASHLGTHAVVVAGPGTGKTRTFAHRVLYLMREASVQPRDIMALSFTRAATAVLRAGLASALGPGAQLPTIATVHAYALSQLLANQEALDALPRPLRIADDWEERNIVFEDLKVDLGTTIKDVRERFNDLSADWERAHADEEGWEERYPDPKFLGAWRRHRDMYGYAVRAELVYQLKRALERSPAMRLQHPPRHLLVDEYQDLNRCDLSVIRSVADTGAELFAAGDDDQSIYGFRWAQPEGIRRFQEEYPNSVRLDLEHCHRCDRRILQIGEFVADLDRTRLPKRIVPGARAAEGEVRLLWFEEEAREADCVARICRQLIARRGQDPGQILILIRSDDRRRFSDPLARSLRIHQVPVAVNVESGTPLDSPAGRTLVAALRLSHDPNDSLAWRTLLSVRRNGIGHVTIARLTALSLERGIRFRQALQLVSTNPSELRPSGTRVAREIASIEALLADVRELIPTPKETAPLLDEASPALLEPVANVAALVIDDADERARLLAYVNETVTSVGAEDIPALLRALAVSDARPEQARDPAAVNIMTMHKAKGLDADVVFVVAAEDEYVPGRSKGRRLEPDERRLLYVSLTRARHRLFITYCQERRGPQRRSGRHPGRRARTLTTYLQDSPLRPRDGFAYTQRLESTLS